MSFCARSFEIALSTQSGTPQEEVVVAEKLEEAGASHSNESPEEETKQAESSTNAEEGSQGGSNGAEEGQEEDVMPSTSHTCPQTGKKPRRARTPVPNRRKKEDGEVGEKFKSGKVQKKKRGRPKKVKDDADDFLLEEYVTNLVPVHRVIPTTVFEFPDEEIPPNMTADLKARTGPKLKWRDENDNSVELCEVATFNKEYKWRSLFEKRRELKGHSEEEAAQIMKEHTNSTISIQ
uniref:Protein CASC3 n=1 Tax=Steinernema glaseri TaxID=37863 RepID=A0A1I7ZW02_9BILA